MSDVIVVGAGAAGCALAVRLAERGRSVLLLEAGADLRRTESPDMLDGWHLPQVPDRLAPSHPLHNHAPECR